MILSRIFHGIDIFKYIYFNFLCKNIVRIDNSKIIPYVGTIIELNGTARINLKGKNLVLGGNKLKGSKSETHVRLNDGAVWNCNNGGYLFYDTVLEIKENAEFTSGYFSANGGSVIIADNKIVFGEDVMIGRNVVVYDSDFHQICDDNGNVINYPRPTIIEDHVWLTSNITVLKGVTIGHDSLITAQTTINKDVPSACIIGGSSTGKVIREGVNWKRERIEK